MAYDTRELAVKIVGDASDFVKSTGEVTAGSKDSQSALEDFAGGAKKAAIVMAGVGVGLTAYAKNATDYTVNLVKSSKEISRETGVTVEQGSQLVYVAQRMGISADQASTVFGKFSKSITAAADSAKNAGQAHAVLQDQIDKVKLEIQQTTAEIAKNGDKTGDLTLKVRTLKDNLSGLEGQMGQSNNAFEKLGINVLDSSGKTKDFNTLLLESADKFRGMKDGSEKTALAMELFGRSGKDMLPILNKGSQGIQELERNADKLGLTLNSSTVASVSKYIQSQKDLTDSTNALKLQIGTLTAPILTNFNQHVNTVVMALISTHNPFHTLVADVLAFGGPIMTATAGIVGFTSNIIQSVEAMGGFRVALTALSGFMMGPWGLALGAAALAIGLVTQHMMASHAQTDALKQAQDSLKTSTDGLVLAQESLQQSQLDIQGASLSVEQAQRDYNTAVAEYGPNSLEARQAAYNLAAANDAYKDAQNRAKDALTQLHDKEKEVAKDRELVAHIQDIRDGMQGLAADTIHAGDEITNQFTGRSITAKTTKDAKGNETLDFVQTFGHRAGGGPVAGGTPYIVGEQGQELFIPDRSGTIVNAKDTKSMVSQGRHGGDMHFHVNVGMYAGMPIEKRQIALELYKELVRAARAQGVQLQMIGAVGVQ